MNKIIFLSGPTATTKTQTALELVRVLGREVAVSCEIVNFDSLLFYRELSIATAKPSPCELEEIKHHLVDIESIQNPMNVSRFVHLAHARIERLFKEDKVPLLVGGSGFYLRALVKGMIDSHPPPTALRAAIREEYGREGIRPFYEYLKEHDPESLESLHRNDHYRLMRAFEHHRMTGRKFSWDKAVINARRPYNFKVNRHPHWDFLHLHLDMPKKEHEGLIWERVKMMIEGGLLEEVRPLLAHKALPPLKSVGHRESVSYLEGEISSKEELTRRIALSTRQLAKSQRTFFKKVTPKTTFHPRDTVSLEKLTVKWMRDAA